MIGFWLVVVGALLLTANVVCVVISQTPLTIGCLVFSALMFVVNFSAWRSTP